MKSMKNLKTMFPTFACLLIVAILTATTFPAATFAQTQSDFTSQVSKTDASSNLQSTPSGFQEQRSDSLPNNTEADTINYENKILSGVKSLKGNDSANSSQPQTTSEPGKNIVYFGGGVSRKSDDFDNLGTNFGDFSENNLAFTFGYLRVSNKSRLIGGADVSYEGTMLDGTFGSYSTRGAFSFNGIVGVNVAKNDKVRFDVAGLIGAREKTTDCPASNLGFACYADRAPDRSYTVNYGGIAAFSYKKLVIGARVTGASTQGLVGIRF